MKTPWMNYKKMQEKTSTQKNCICSSKVNIKSKAHETGSQQIYIVNTEGIQIKSINRSVTWQKNEMLAKNKSGQLAQNEHFHERPEYMNRDQLIQDDGVVNNKKEAVIANPTELRINPVYDESVESLNQPAFDPINASQSNISEENHISFDHEKYYGNQDEQIVHESYVNNEADQFPQSNQAIENQKNHEIIAPTKLRINPVYNESFESSNKPASDPINASQSNISEENQKTFEHEKYNGLQDKQLGHESYVNNEADLFSKANQANENQENHEIVNPTELRINPVYDESVESLNQPAFDPINASQSNISEENHISFDHEKYNGNHDEQLVHEASAYEVSNQVSQPNQAPVNQNEIINDGINSRISPVYDVRSESPIQPPINTSNSSESNMLDEGHKTFDHKGIHEKDVPADTEEFHINKENGNESDPLIQNDHFYESPAYTDGAPFTQDDRAADPQNNNTITDTTDVQINSVHAVSSEPSIDPVLDPANSSESNMSDESHKTFDHEEMNENVQDSFNTEEINHNSMPAPHFINIRVPVVVGEYNLEVCLEEVVTFKEKVRRIKEISNNVVLTNCKFVPTQLSQVLDNGTCKALEGYLFIEGSIHQSIEYVADGTEEFAMNGKLCSMKRKSPFSITVKMDCFLHPPIFGSNAQTTFEFLDQNNTQIPQLDTKIFHSTINYPEQPYCQLISSKIHESVCLKDIVYHLNQSVVVPKKYQLDQKIVVEVFVHLLQIQHVRVKSDDKWS